MIARFRTTGTPVAMATLAKLAAALLALALAGTAVADGPRVRLVTSMGEIVVELDAEKAPRSTENFLAYAKDGFYDGTLFHRVISTFMIQGGGFDRDFNRKQTRPPIPNEAQNGLSNRRGTIAMARTRDPDSATAQFFINVVDNVNLNHTAPTQRGWGYAVFGRVVAGMEVVDAIRAVPTGRQGRYSDVPVEPVVIESARIVEIN